MLLFFIEKLRFLFFLLIFLHFPEPTHPPRVTFGNFEIVDTEKDRMVMFYWQKLDEKDINGKGFNYTIEWDLNQGYVRKPVREINPKTQEYTEPDTVAKFSGIDKNQDHYFYIYAMNEMGRTDHYTTVHIPKEIKRIPPSLSGASISSALRFVKSDLDRNKTILQWSHPTDILDEVTNYTIFWCNSMIDRSYQCSGKLDWTIVDNTTTSLEMEIYSKDNYKFAIAVNTRHFSSGMIWAECNVMANSGLKIKHIVIVHINDRYVDLQWENECSDKQDHIKGYKFLYCPTTIGMNDSCLKKEKVFILYGNVSTPRKVRIENLEYYTTYKFRGVIMGTSSNDNAELSPAVYGTTLEGAPSPPRNLNVTRVTNSSISYQFSRPVTINGFLKDYHVVYHVNGIEENMTVRKSVFSKVL